MERLQKVIAQAGIASRRKAEQLIVEGKVKVNGKTVRQMGVQVSSSDTVEVNGVEIGKEQKVYFLFNKPKKCVCTVNDDKDRETVMDYFQDVRERIFPVGRLDYETTGLLIMTNDGEFANLMMHPRNHIHKTYEVAVKGIITDDMCRMLENGINLQDGMTLPSEVIVLQRSRKKNRTVLQITIQEGRNRQVRRMMEFFHCEVTRLNRIQYEFLDLGQLRQGQYRRLRSYEVRKRKNIANANLNAE